MSIFFSSTTPTMTITLTNTQWLAVAASLRGLDDDRLEDDGVLPGVTAHLDEAWETIEEAVSKAFGDDWPLLVTTQEQLEIEAEEREGDELA